MSDLTHSKLTHAQAIEMLKLEQARVADQASRVEELERELADAAPTPCCQEWDVCNRPCTPHGEQMAEKELASLRQQLEQARQDAARYRWLRIKGKEQRDLSNEWYPDETEFELRIDAALAPPEQRRDTEGK